MALPTTTQLRQVRNIQEAQQLRQRVAQRTIQEREIARQQEAQRLAQQQAQEAQVPQLSLDEQAYNLAVDWVNRKIQGKYIIRVPSSPEEVELYARANQIYGGLVQSKELQEKMYAGSAYRIATREGGGWVPSAFGDTSLTKSVAVGTEALAPKLQAALELEESYTPKVSVTTQEATMLSPVTAQSQVSTEEEPSFLSRAYSKYLQAEGYVARKITEPFGNWLSSKGITAEGVSNQPIVVTPFATAGIIGSLLQKTDIGKGVGGILTKESSAFTQGQIQEIKEKPIKNIVLFGLGAGSAAGIKILGAGSRAVGGFIGGIKGAQIATGVTETILTTSGLLLTGKYVYDVGGKISRVEKSGEVGTILGRESVNLAAVGAGAYTGNIVSQKVEGWIRTRGMKEIPTEDVVAPEYYKGQRYPRIRKGQTAGQLKAEFRPQLPGETKPAGYTASPETIAKITKAGKGSSELYGYYQAPRLNPTFFKISSEKQKLFSFIVKTRGSPTATRVTPTGYEFIKGVSSSQKSLTPLSKAKSFFESSVELGKAYIPFIKTEKEAVIPMGTPLVRTAERFFIKFKGVKIPIYEYATTTGGKVTTGTSTAVTLGRVSSYYKPYSSAIYSPLNIGLLGLKSSQSSSTAKTSSTYIPSTPSKPSKPSYPNYPYSPTSPYASITSKSISYTPSVTSVSISTPSGSSIAPPARSAISYTSQKYPEKVTNITEIKTNRFKLAKPVTPKTELGYRTFYFRKGRKEYLPGTFERSQAIRRGEKRVLSTISARFGIEKSQARVYSTDKTYTPSSKVFRGYLIRGKRRLALEDEWIQKSGSRREPTTKGARLASSSEIKDLLSFKKRKRSNTWF